MRPRFREGEVVRLVATAGGAPLEGVVEDVPGPDESGTRWTVSLWVEDPRRGRSLRVAPEDELEPTGLAEGPEGERFGVDALPEPPERRTTIQLRIATSLTDGGLASQAADQVEEAVRELVGPARIVVEAERHWSEPFPYQLDLYVQPVGDAVAAFRALADAGEEGWLSCTDDGWRCDLWWCRPDDDVLFLGPDVHGAQISFVPWDSPARRPELERPLVAVQVADGLDDAS
jgi:hypothetical protein